MGAPAHPFGQVGNRRVGQFAGRWHFQVARVAERLDQQAFGGFARQNGRAGVPTLLPPFGRIEQQAAAQFSAGPCLLGMAFQAMLIEEWADLLLEKRPIRRTPFGRGRVRCQTDRQDQA